MPNAPTFHSRRGLVAPAALALLAFSTACSGPRLIDDETGADD